MQCPKEKNKRTIIIFTCTAYAIDLPRDVTLTLCGNHVALLSSQEYVQT
jgi:hypothetical protein